MTPGERINLISAAFISALILILGIGLLCTDVLIDRIPKPNRTYLGVVFIVYSLYRGYRTKLHFDRLKREGDK